MKCALNLLIFFLVFVILDSISAFKDKDAPFRIQKLNILWQKGKKTLEDKRLKSFYNDLKNQDKEELTLKKLRSNNYDKAEMRESQVQKQFLLILRKYGLELAENAYGDVESEMPKDEQLFKDVKLDRLWKKAQSIDVFNDKQLKMIKEEIRAYEEKLELYHELVMKVDEQKHADAAKRTQEENHIDIDENSRSEKYRMLEELNAKLKEKHHYLKSEYDNLLEMVRNLTNDDHQHTDFEEATVLKLWKLAEKSDFMDEELEPLKNELKNLEKKIQKLKYFESQLHRDEIAGKEFAFDDANEHDQHVQRKVKELGTKVERLHAELEQRILQRHSEL